MPELFYEIECLSSQKLSHERIKQHNGFIYNNYCILIDFESKYCTEIFWIPTSTKLDYYFLFHKIFLNKIDETWTMKFQLCQYQNVYKLWGFANNTNMTIFFTCFIEIRSIIMIVIRLTYIIYLIRACTWLRYLHTQTKFTHMNNCS